MNSLFSTLQGLRIAMVVWDCSLNAQVGARATAQLLHDNGLDWREYNPRDYAANRLLGRYDMIMVASGSDQEVVFDERAVLIESALPIVLMPPANVPASLDSSIYARVFVSNPRHQQRIPVAELVADPMLSLHFTGPDVRPRFKQGVFLASDNQLDPTRARMSLGDPLSLCRSVESCVELCNEFGRIVTDNAAMAVIARQCGRDVTVLPNPDGSTQALIASGSDIEDFTWPSHLDDLEHDRPASQGQWVERLLGTRHAVLPLHARPRRVPGWRVDEKQEAYQLTDPDGRAVQLVNAISALIWGLCNGELGVRDMITDLADAYDRDLVEIGRDIQAVLRELLRLGAIELVLDRPPDPAGDTDTVWKSVPNVIRRGRGRAPMRMTVHEPWIGRGMVHRHATLSQYPDGDEWDLWFRMDQRHADAMTNRADPFLLVAVHHAMDRKASALWIEGAPVTRTLLANVDEFQRAWACWRADMSIVPLVAAEETEEPAPMRPGILCFSGGIDSCHSVYRHLLHEESQRGPRITAALMVHGFDIPLMESRGFETALGRNRRILRELPLELVTMETNIRNINLNWDRSHVLGCAAALTLLGERFGTGLIAGTFPYNQLRAGGSNPTTDWLLGSRYFEIRNDQAASTRLGKILELVRWPHALRHARFCWKDDRYGNCGHCSKCITTAMMLRCAGVEVLECFTEPVSDDFIARRLQSLGMAGALQQFDLREIHRFARDNDQRFSWLPILQARLGTHATDGAVGAADSVPGGQ